MPPRTSACRVEGEQLGILEGQVIDASKSVATSDSFGEETTQRDALVPCSRYHQAIAMDHRAHPQPIRATVVSERNRVQLRAQRPVTFTKRLAFFDRCPGSATCWRRADESSYAACTPSNSLVEARTSCIRPAFHLAFLSAQCRPHLALPTNLLIPASMAVLPFFNLCFASSGCSFSHLSSSL